MRMFLISCSIAAGVAACAKTDGGGDVAWPTLTGEAPIVIAHRGASGYRPEHTLAAYELAIEQGADFIEPDLVLTSDGVLVARHDRHLSTTTNVADLPEFALRKKPNPDPNGEGRTDWWVEDFTLAEIRKLRARQPRQGRGVDYDDRLGIPTFDEIIDLATAASSRERKIGLYPEIKHPDYFQSIDLSPDAALIESLARYRDGPIFLQSFESGILKRLKGKTDAKLVQLVYEATPGAGANVSFDDMTAYADGVGAAKRIITSSFTTSDEGRSYSAYIQTAHRLGLFVHAWTYRDDEPDPGMEALYESGAFVSGDPATEKALSAARSATEFELIYAYSLGVDGVFADHPDSALVARERAK